MDRSARLEFAGGHDLRRSLVMGAYRGELTGVGDGQVVRLKARGLMSEIIV